MGNTSGGKKEGDEKGSKKGQDETIVLNVGPTHTGVFNIADIAITVGALYLLQRLGTE